LTPFANRFFAREVTGRLFRVYVQGGNLRFVKVADPDVVRGLISFLPIAGGFVQAWWDERARRALMARLEADDRRDLRALLGRDACNFSIAAHQIKLAVVDPPDFAVERPHHGVLRIQTSSRKAVFLFEELEEMTAAIRLLRESLDDLLVNHAVWSPQKKRFISERALAMSSRSLTALS